MHVVCANCGKLLDESDTRCWNCGAERDPAPARPQAKRVPSSEDPLAAIAGLGAGSLLAFVILVVDRALYTPDTAPSAWISVGLISIVGIIIVLLIPMLISIPHRTSVFARWLFGGAIALFALTAIGVLTWMGILAVCHQLFKNV